MWVDIAVLLFILLMGIIGYKNGFIYTFIRMVGWVTSIVVAFIFYPKVSLLIKENTEFYDFIHRSLMKEMATAGVSPDVWLHSFPSAITDLIGSVSEAITESLVLTVTNVVFSVMTFFIIVFGVKIIAFILTNLFSKRKIGGIVGGFDGLLGLVSGLIMGLLLVFILLALVVPITTMSGNTFFLDSIEGSMLTKEFFNQNLLLLIFEIL